MGSVGRRALLTELSGVDLDPVERFRAEPVHEDGGSPDVEGLADQGRPLVMVKAKFTAVLTAGQVRAYVDDQGRRGLSQSGVVAVLVPPHRVEEVRQVVVDMHKAGLGTSSHGSAVVILDWQTLPPLGQAAQGATWRDR